MSGSAYSAIYSFGDSLSDAGSIYLLSTNALAASFGLTPEPADPPYYQETYTTSTGGSIAADVFSNGPVWVQDLAAALGLANPAPGQVGLTASALLGVLEADGESAAEAAGVVALAERSHPPTGADDYIALTKPIVDGTDFALGGSVTGVTAYNTSAFDVATDLAAQLASFQAEYPNPAANALYTVWSGSNDLLDMLGSASLPNLLASGEYATDIAQSVQNEIAMVRSLVEGGAQTVLVLNVPDLGKVPEVTAQGSAASATATMFASTFNTDLKAALAATDFGTASVKLVDIYSLIDSVTVGTDGLTNVTDPVIQSTGLVSTDPAVQDQYLFFDGVHPTATGHEAIAQLAETDLAAPCFCPGTLIGTEHGEVAVEILAIGDRLRCADGLFRPIRWIGRRDYAGAFVAGNPLMLPVCVKAGALDDGVPARDLHLSPGHALFVDGRLVPAWRLINGASIVQAPAVQTVSYYHIELDRHAVLMAEGAPAESFLDDGCRNQFQNFAEFARLYPNSSLMAPLADRLEDGFGLQAIQARLARRAGLASASGPFGPLRGYVDMVAPDAVRGWAQDVASPEKPVALQIVIGNRPVLCVLANAYRADLRGAGLGSGCHAFSSPLPDGLAGPVEVRRITDGAILAHAAPPPTMKAARA